ncbi:MAG: hypothetical protein PUP92_07670 [Rhizonema sp. PD38]|nr:hypothetical protein [Rhizonema sp. PD38]
MLVKGQLTNAHSPPLSVDALFHHIQDLRNWHSAIALRRKTFSLK